MGQKWCFVGGLRSEVTQVHLNGVQKAYFLGPDPPSPQKKLFLAIGLSVVEEFQGHSSNIFSPKRLNVLWKQNRAKCWHMILVTLLGPSPTLYLWICGNLLEKVAHTHLWMFIEFPYRPTFDEWYCPDTRVEEYNYYMKNNYCTKKKYDLYFVQHLLHFIGRQSRTMSCTSSNFLNQYLTIGL